MQAQDLAERKVKSLQKEFLSWVEHHPVFYALDPDEFNELRRDVFRGTFEAYRLGVVGLDRRHTSLCAYFFGWLDTVTVRLEPRAQREISAECFRVALEAYRVGAMLAVAREATHRGSGA